MRRLRGSGGRTRGGSRASSSSSPRSTSPGRSSRSSSLSGSRSTRAALARPPRGGRCAGTRSDPDLSVLHDSELSSALLQSLRLAAIAVLVTVPLGVALAIGLTRWRGRGAGTSRAISLATLVTPEIVMGTALLLVIVHLLTFIRLGTVAQAIGHITFSLVVRRDHRARSSARDRPAVRGSGARPRCIAAPGVAPRAAADARSRDRRERDHRLRDLDGRLRHQRVPVVGHLDGHGPGADLLAGSDCADARAERAGDGHPRAHDRDRARGVPAVARSPSCTRADRIDGG